MALFANFIKLLFLSAGHAKDVTLEVSKAYLQLLRRALALCLIPASIGIILVIGGAWLSHPRLLAVGVVIFAVLSIVIILISLPLVEIAAYAVEHGIAARSLKLAGIAFGWLMLGSLVAYASPPDSNLWTRVLIAVLSFVPAYLIFGYGVSRKALGIKMAIIVGAMTFGVALPRTNAMVSNLVAYVDRGLSRVVDSTFKELELSQTTLERVQMFASDGTPLYWCRVAQERPAKYRCFDRPGKDPYNQQELRPISSEMLDIINRNLAAAPKPLAPAPSDPLNTGSARLNEGRVANSHASAGGPATPIPDPSTKGHTQSGRQYGKDPASNFLTPNAIPKSAATLKPQWAIVAWSVQGSPDGRLAHEIERIGIGSGFPDANQVLSESFVNSGASRRVLKGDSTPLRSLDLAKYVDYLVLAEFTIVPQRETEGNALRSSTGELNTLLVRLSDLSTAARFRVVEGGAGADFDDAGERAYERVMQSAAPKLRTAIKGLTQ